MDMIEELNPQQKEAVLTQSQHVRVIAGAGSGKTRVLTTRIVHLIRDLGYFPSRICAITFTNKAANEMKERMEKMHPDAVRVHTSTIHSLCVRILREEYDAVGLIRNFIILDSADQQSILRDAYKEFQYDRKELPMRDVLNYISNNKIADVSVNQAIMLAGNDTYESRKAKVYAYYMKRCKDMSALDFDDLLIVVNKLFKEDERIRQKWQRRFQVILVDEFQDVDMIQYGIVQSLVGDENELYVVGDPDQTIYTWRGANVNFIIDFDQHYPDAETIVLNQNYRSSQNILDKANHLIINNSNRHEKDLFANKTNEHEVTYQGFDSAEEEAAWIAKTINELKHDGGSYLDSAVLYRSNYLSRALEKALVSRQIPYVVYGGLRFYDQAEIKDMMSYLRMITHADDLALRRSIGVPRRGIGEKSLDTISLTARDRGITMYESMLIDVQDGSASPKVRKYVNMIESFKQMAQTLPVDRLMRNVLEESGLKAHFEKLEEMERLASINELIQDAVQFQKSYEDSGLEEYIQMISLYSDKEDVVTGDYVRLMTIHASKGLEFENVFILGLSDDIFPNRNSIREGKDGIQEERRLMYVAITRARERLFLSNNFGFNFAISGTPRVSRFIKEMGFEEGSKNPFMGSLEMDSFIDVSVEAYEREAGFIRKNNKFKKGNIVVHTEFGEGIIINVEDEMMRVAFNFPYGTRTISKKFQGIALKGDLS